MASKRTLNEQNLEVLGTARLTELLIQISAHDPGAKRRLRLEIAAAVSPGVAVTALLKRFDAIRGSTSNLSAEKKRVLGEELEAHRQLIMHHLLPVDAHLAMEAMFKLISLAVPVWARTNLYTPDIKMAFHQAARDIGAIVGAARPSRGEVVPAIHESVVTNQHGLARLVLDSLFPTLGEEGLSVLQQKYQERLAERQRQASADGRINYARMQEISSTQEILRSIADALGDVDAFMAQYDGDERQKSAIAAAIANRLLAANRFDEAWKVIEGALPNQFGAWSDDWHECRIAALYALGQDAEAEKARWSYFERSLKDTVLRACLLRMPESDGRQAEQRALKLAETSNSLDKAVDFLISWGDWDRAAALVTKRSAEVQELGYFYLMDMGDVFEADYPLVATVLHRAFIQQSLEFGKTVDIKDAARYLAKCRALAQRIADWAELAPHDQYEKDLRRHHEYNYYFWDLVSRQKP